MWFDIVKALNSKVNMLVADFMLTTNDAFTTFAVQEWGEKQTKLFIDSEGSEGKDYRHKKVLGSGIANGEKNRQPTFEMIPSPKHQTISKVLLRTNGVKIVGEEKAPISNRRRYLWRVV
jgi:hypothetical protein